MIIFNYRYTKYAILLIKFNKLSNIKLNMYLKIFIKLILNLINLFIII